MPDRPYDTILARSDEALLEFGDNHLGANWPNEEDRRRRFDVMLDVLAGKPAGPVVLCDLGCGTGEMLAHIRRRGIPDVEYIGVDRSDVALSHARAKFPGVRFLHVDINDPAADLAQIDCDYLISNGLFTVKWNLTQVQMQAFLESSVERVWPHVRRGIAFNVMSKVVDWERDDLFHVPMDDIARLLHRLAGRRVRMRADYGLYEYTAFAFKDPSQAEATRLVEALPTGTRRAAAGGSPHAQLAVKRALQDAGISSETAFAAYRQELKLPTSDFIRPKTLRGLREAAAIDGVAFIEYEAAGAGFTVAPPRVTGRGNHRPLQCRARSDYVACFRDARIRSRSSVVFHGDDALLDFEAGELESIDDQIDLDPAVFRVENGKAWSVEAAETSVGAAIPEAFSLVGTHTWAFGHWMWEYLPRYLAATMRGDMPPMPVLVDAGMPRQHVQSLQAMLAPGWEIRELPPHAVTRVERLWMAPAPMYMPLLERMNERFRWDLLAAHPGRFSAIIDEMKRRMAVERDASSPDKVWFARKPARHRKLVNAEAIEAIAKDEGFAVVYPEDMDFAAQARLVANARCVAGPEGSAMFMNFLAAPGTKVCILNHPYTLGLPVLTGLLEAVGIDVSVFTGPAVSVNEEWPHFVDYEIDPESFRIFLAGFVRGGNG